MALFVAFAGAFLAIGDITPQAQTSRTALLAELDGAIGPASADYVSRAIDAARDRNAALIVLRIDTPGGLDTSMRVIVRDILSAPVPIIGYVAPSGARAASAGTYILYATHVAAMAPGTDLGAATPVQIGGGGLLPRAPSGDDKEEDKPETPTIKEKAVSEAVAYIRALAQMRGRNVEWAEKAVREAASLSAEDALTEGVINILARDTADLLAQLDGRLVSTIVGETILDTEGLTLDRYEPDWRTRFLSVITNPNVAYILLLIGVYGILLEFYSPGVLVPGITGVICLLLAFYALHVLPISYAGLALLFLGLALMVGEAFVPSFGALGLGGAVAFVIGSVMLIDTEAPGFQVSRMLIGSIAAVSAGLFLFVMMMMLRARRRAVVTGPEELVQSRGEVIDWQGTRGRVRVHGEIWKARAARALAAGRPVRVVSIEGLTLVVEPQGEPPQREEVS